MRCRTPRLRPTDAPPRRGRRRPPQAGKAFQGVGHPHISLGAGGQCEGVVRVALGLTGSPCAMAMKARTVRPSSGTSPRPQRRCRRPSGALRQVTAGQCGFAHRGDVSVNDSRSGLVRCQEFWAARSPLERRRRPRRRWRTRSCPTLPGTHLSPRRRSGPMRLLVCGSRITLDVCIDPRQI